MQKRSRASVVSIEAKISLASMPICIFWILQNKDTVNIFLKKTEFQKCAKKMLDSERVKSL